MPSQFPGARPPSPPSRKQSIGALRGNSYSSTSLKKSKVILTNLRDKLQFVNSVKCFVFDLTEIPFLKCLISISRLMVEALNDQNLFTESKLANKLVFELCPVLFRYGGHF